MCFLVILREIGSHLQWTVHRYIKCQLTADGRVAMRTIGAIHFKDTRCIIHRTTLQTGERQDGGMSRFGTSESLIFSTARAPLVANQVRISAAETGWTHSLMGIYHDVIIGSTGYGMQIVVDFQLTVVMLATRNDVAT